MAHRCRLGGERGRPNTLGDLNGSSQRFIFFGKMGCSDETQTSDIFYSRAEEGDMGPLATRRVHEFNRA
jgi:hypothetical protein